MAAIREYQGKTCDGHDSGNSSEKNMRESKSRQYSKQYKDAQS
jgi:hypothetical protein